MSRLTTNVHVTDPQGRAVVLGPEDDVPAWALAAITNPDVWDGPAPTVDPQDGDEPPPKGGPGSSKDAWHAYAGKHDVQVPSESPREDVIAALERAGVRTE